MAFSPETLKCWVDSREYSRPIQTATYPPFTNGTILLVSVHIQPRLDYKARRAVLLNLITLAAYLRAALEVIGGDLIQHVP